jgi:hypothetical protein
MRSILAGCQAENGDTLSSLADKEHPAAKAGRYVRAAGIVIGKEIDRRSAEAAAKPAPAAPPPPPPPPPPPVETTTFAGRWLFRLFVASLVVLGLSILHFADLVPGATAEKVVRLVLAGLLALEAFVLISNWRRGNERVGQRLLNRMWGPRGAANKREKAVARAVRDVLTLIGILFVAAAVYQLLVATIGT